MKNTQYLEQLARESQERLSAFSRSEEALAKRAELGRPLTQSELEWLEIEVMMEELVDLCVMEAVIENPELFLDNYTVRPCESLPEFYDYEDGQYEWEEGSCYYCNQKKCCFRTEEPGEDVFFATDGKGNLIV